MSFSPRTESDRNSEFLITEEPLVINRHVSKRDNYVCSNNNIPESSGLVIPINLISDRAESQDEEDLLRIHTRRINATTLSDDIDTPKNDDDLSKFQITPKKIGQKPSKTLINSRYFGSRENLIKRGERRFATHFSNYRGSEEDSATEPQLSHTNLSDKQNDFSFVKKSTNADSIDISTSRVKSLYYKGESKVYPLIGNSGSKGSNEEFEKKLNMIKEESPPAKSSEVMHPISLFNPGFKKRGSLLINRLNSLTRRRRSSQVFETEEEALRRKQNTSRLLNTFTKVVRAISILRNRAGLSSLSAANENQVRIINDWSWFHQKVPGHQRVNK
jgi:hypothetical protein